MQLLARWGWEMKEGLRMDDSSAAKAIASRLGLGRARHLEFRYVSVEELVNSRLMVMRNIGTKANLADLLAKLLPRAVTRAFPCQRWALFCTAGRAPIDPAVAGGGGVDISRQPCCDLPCGHRQRPESPAAFGSTDHAISNTQSFHTVRFCVRAFRATPERRACGARRPTSARAALGGWSPSGAPAAFGRPRKRRPEAQGRPSGARPSASPEARREALRAHWAEARPGSGSALGPHATAPSSRYPTEVAAFDTARR